MSDLALALDRLGDRARHDAPLGPLTTYRVGGAAAALVDVDSVDDLRAVADALRGLDVPVLVVGRGSNLLVADAGFEGVALTLGEGLAHIDVEATTVRAGGAASLPVVARRTAAAGLAGFEWAVGVPGSVGGAVRMNAGGHGSDMAAVLRSIHVIDLRGGEDVAVPASALELRYRHSNVRPSQVVVEAVLELSPGDRGASEREISDIVRWRRAHQPGGQNAGSVFTNPPGDSAGRLIDAAGAKGFRIGTAAVSDKHANFIQADDGGSADDVLAVMAEVRRRVLDHAGVLLEPETRIVGARLPDPEEQP
ncbi:UDP-N-acetylmuramate dehydrogenase [Actinomarinicola tropica]|uniref:UDP-N-acetylmuramate dehydrogenase n=1 Tax=Actinomarinicola tropica TaxID=2789776 RepID=UPI0018982AE2|nr:UDP-N-acetylmuramate dehydrogenase [Actinomarinicola tropica]